MSPGDVGALVTGIAVLKVAFACRFGPIASKGEATGGNTCGHFLFYNFHFFHFSLFTIIVFVEKNVFFAENGSYLRKKN